MDEIDYNELFGVKANAAEAETEPEVADPDDAEQDDNGAEEQEVAEPAVERDRNKDARYAAARRKAEAERDSAIEEAKAAAKAEAEKYINEAFKASGMMNPYTNKLITSKEEFDEYKKALDEDSISRVKDNAGMTDEEFDRFVSDLPEVREAREAKAEADRRAEEAKSAEFKAQVDREIEMIHALDPIISSVEDFSKMDTFQEFKAFVDKGYSFIDAFKLANFDTLRQTSAKAAKQAAKNAESKEHLTRTAARGTGAESVPDDVLEQYRLFNPKATDAEILAHYNKFLQK